MREFIFQMLPMRVVFGAGRRQELGSELHSLAIQRVLVITDPSHRTLAARIAGTLGESCVGIHDEVVQHIPVEVAKAAIARVRGLGADGCVTVGGGSATGLGKAIALNAGVSLVAIPTTYAGSEMTSIWGLTERGEKRTGRDPRVLPRLVIYDPELLITLPPRVAGPSGMNAIAHCVEALYAKDTNPVISILAQEGVRALARALPEVVRHPRDVDAQGDSLYGAWLAGMSLGSVGMALHHKLCHVLGGTFDTPHAETHAVVLPYATAFNLHAAPEAKERLATALGTSAVAGRLWELGRKVGAPSSLKQLGFREDDIDRAAQLAVQEPYYNPREVTFEAVRRLLADAYEGRRPEP